VKGFKNIVEKIHFEKLQRLFASNDKKNVAPFSLGN